MGKVDKLSSPPALLLKMINIAKVVTQAPMDPYLGGCLVQYIPCRENQ